MMLAAGRGDPGEDGEDVAISVLMVVVPTVLAVAATLVVRRHSPPGGLMSRMESSDGIFEAAAAGLAVLLGFVIFAVFTSYGNARSSTGEEAVAVQQMYQTAGFFPDRTDELRGEVVCYGRSVIDEEWPTMTRGGESTVTQHWADRLDTTIQQAHVVGNGQGAALRHWLQLGEVRQEARRTRLAEGRAFVPGFVWFILVLVTVTLVLFQCLFADPRATAFGQGVAMAAMATTLFAGLTLVRVLDRPFDDRGAQIQPSRMAASLRIMSQEASFPSRLPCDRQGNPA